MLTAIFYLGGLFVLSKLNYNGKPAVYITNDYYIWKGGGTYEKFNAPDSFKNKDVIIVGSSRAYRSYNPESFAKIGLRAWNLGSSAQSIENSYRVIKEVILPAKPKLILLDVARLGFEQESIESSIDLLTNTRNIGLKKEIVKSGRDIRLYNTAITSFYTDNLSSLYKDKEYKNAGFSTKSDSLNAEWLNKLDVLTEESKNKTIINDFNVLVDILELCKSRNQKIIMVHSPVSEFYSMIAQNAFVEKVDSIANEFKIAFYDMQYIDGIHTKTHFYDDSHLNAAGVTIFNRYLFKKIKFN